MKTELSFKIRMYFIILCIISCGFNEVFNQTLGLVIEEGEISVTRSKTQNRASLIVEERGVKRYQKRKPLEKFINQITVRIWNFSIRAEFPVALVGRTVDTQSYLRLLMTTRL